MECQLDKNEYVRHLLLAFNQGYETARDICAVYGDEMLRNNQTVNATLYVEPKSKKQFSWKNLTGDNV